MIDTVGFKADITERQYRLLQRKSQMHFGVDNEKNEHIYSIVKSNIPVGSYDSRVVIRSYDEDIVDFQVSLPKFYFGNNVQLLPCGLVEQAVAGVYDGLRGYFGDWPHYRDWFVHRLDCCYAWRFADQSTVADIIKILSCFDYPRKKKHIYPKESVMWSGRAYSVKFYLKQPEYLKHQDKCITDEEYRRDAELVKLSEGVLRYELSFRHSMMSELFYGKGYISYKHLQDEEKITEILRRHLNYLLSNLDTRLTSDNDVLTKLKHAYSHKKALRLYTFYKQFYSELEHERQFLKNNYSQSTLWRNKHDLSVAKVGIPSSDIPLDFSLEIPCALAKPLLPSAVAGAENLGLGINVTPPKPCIDAI